MTLRTLLVDDEPLALERLRGFLATDADLEIVGEATDGRRAVEALERLRPDLLFLDIQMPELDGFEVLEALGTEHLPVVVFVTAFDRFALRAFEAQALDYLLKPFGRARLLETVARAKRRVAERGGEAARVATLLAEPRPQARFLVRQEGRLLAIPAPEVEAIEAEANYMWLHRGREAHPLRGTLAGLQARLDPQHFCRCHRSWIVNVDQVRELQVGPGEVATARTASGLRIPVSLTHRKALEEAMGRGQSLG